jgi:hypothetical protein
VSTSDVDTEDMDTESAVLVTLSNLSPLLLLKLQPSGAQRS